MHISCLIEENQWVQFYIAMIKKKGPELYFTIGLLIAYMYHFQKS